MVTQDGKCSSALAHARIAVAVDVSFAIEQTILPLRPDWAQEAAPDELAANGRISSVRNSTTFRFPDSLRRA
jgi:hypothetical protein